ncbi:MAG: DUF523 and DUF1722 domain-containing protein [Gammaproteobacteria bacterium]
MDGPSSRPIIGVSSCLLGQRVRYDGGHKREAFVVEDLATRFELLPICPEMAIGMGVPRPPLQLVLEADGIHARGVHDPDLDVTEQLLVFARQTLPGLSRLCGYVFKARSPSCGVGSTPVLVPGHPSREDSGLFAAALQAAFPHLPVEQEDRLRDPALRDLFLERVYACQQRQHSRLHDQERGSGINP